MERKRQGFGGQNNNSAFAEAMAGKAKTNNQ